MNDRTRAFMPAAVLAMAVVMAGCAGAAVSLPAATSASPGAVPSTVASTRETATPATGSVAPSGSTPSAPAGSASPPGVTLDQDWATAELVDVTTGETFRIADHAGTVVILETMAIWCSNCRAQQRDVRTALEQLPADAVAYVVLDVDPNENGASLASYREQQGFDGRYAVAGSAVARALAAEFGDQVLNPPSTPIVFIGTDGRVTLTEFGYKTPDELVALARAHGA
jgi:thiol-disulfide isomerase/thioredoxin